MASSPMLRMLRGSQRCHRAILDCAHGALVGTDQYIPARGCSALRRSTEQCSSAPKGGGGVIVVKSPGYGTAYAFRPASPLPQRVEAPRARTGGREVEPDEAEQDRGVSLVQDRPEALGRVADEVRDRHLPGEQEGHRTREQADQEERASESLQDGRDARQGCDGRGAAAWHDGRRKGEQLGRPELDEEERGHDPEQAEQVRCPRWPPPGGVRCRQDASVSGRWRPPEHHLVSRRRGRMAPLESGPVYDFRPTPPR